MRIIATIKKWAAYLMYGGGWIILPLLLYVEATHTQDRSEEEYPSYTDGIYKATAKINDSITSQADVKIRSDSVIQINLPNGYYSLEDSIISAPIDSGYATVGGRSGNTYFIDIQEKE